MDIFVEQGATLSRSITWVGPAPASVPVNLTGARVEFQWRDPNGVLVVDFDSTALTAGLTLDTPLGVSGVIAFSVSAALTAAMSFGTAAWDLFVTLAGGERDRLAHGTVKLTRAVTR